MGYIYEDHKTAQNLHGYTGDIREQQAHIIVRKQHVGRSANDVGFYKKSDGKYQLIISEYDSRSGSASAENFLGQMKSIYAKHVSLKELQYMGIITSSIEQQKNQKIKIKAFW